MLAPVWLQKKFGLKPDSFSTPYAALKGRSSTVVAHSVCGSFRRGSIKKSFCNLLGDVFSGLLSGVPFSELVGGMLLRIRGWSLRRRGCAEAGGIEGEGFYFAFVALGGDGFAFEGEGEAGGVAGFYDDFVSGAN